ncbi:hypothetical protein Tco_0514591 [Tanacetum coccineum]
MAYSSSSSNANSKENSSKGLNKLLDSQLSANDKAGIGHDGAKESKVSETITSVSKVETSNSKTSNEKVEMPKIETVRMSEPIIEEWESDSEDDEIVVKPKEVTRMNEIVRQVENPRKNNKSPRGKKEVGMEKEKGFTGKMIVGVVVTHGIDVFVEYSLVKPYDEWVNGEQEALKVSDIDATVCYDAIFGQTATGKESSNPFMAGSLPKMIHLCDSLQKFKNHLSDNEESLGEDASKQGRIDDADAEVAFIDETSNDARNKNNKISNNN